MLGLASQGTPMELTRIGELLGPFAPGVPLQLLAQIRLYLDLLLRWNARTNLTAVRDPGQIVIRHFGESLFAARVLVGEAMLPGPPSQATLHLADIGSGAGFPGVPIKLFAPQCKLTLVESQNKKATFLREVIRSLDLSNAEVFCGRAEHWGDTAELVTLRAVERFGQVLAMSTRLLAPGGRLALLIGEDQLIRARENAPALVWDDPYPIPGSTQRVLAVGRSQAQPYRPPI